MEEKFKILVVDDNPALCKGVCRILQADGYMTSQAHSGRDAIEAVGKEQPDLVLLDVIMPDLGGYETCREIKKQSPDTFVVLMSGKKTQSDQQAEGLEVGADGYIARPVSNRELSARVKAMLRIKRAEMELRKSEEKYRSVIENAGVGIFVLAPDGMILDANPAFCQMVGFRKEQLVGKSAPHPFFPVDNTKAMDRDFSYLRRKNYLNRETFMQKSNGERFPISITGSPVFDDSGEPSSFICFVQDITEKRKAEAAMVKTQKLEAVGVMVSGIAHDLNNLLTMILGNIDLSQMDAEPGTEMHNTLTHAREACIMTRDLIRQYAQVAESGASNIEEGNITDAVLEAARFESLDKDVKFKFALDENLWPHHFDYEKIKTAFREVLRNAIEASSESGVVTVKVENARVSEKDNELLLDAGNYVKISVIDQGVGIRKKDLDKIFDPYFSTKQRGEAKGMGLGLAIAQNIIRAHSGAIIAQSEKGKGTTIKMYLPARD